MNKSKTTEMDIEQITQEDQDIMSWEEVAKAINSAAYTVQEAAARVSSINKPPILPRMKHRVWPVEGVRYLGKLIMYDLYFQGWHLGEPEPNATLCGIFLDLTDLKIKILENYAPTKTLEWLKNKTEHEWFYNDRVIECETNEYVYFLDDGVCYIDKNGYLIIDDDDIVESFEVTLTPREFIEKIAKGEWV